MWLIKQSIMLTYKLMPQKRLFFLPPTENNQLWTIIKESAADKTGINQVTIDLRNAKGKLISHAACKRNDETFSLLMESSFDIKEPTDKILELMDPPTP